MHRAGSDRRWFEVKAPRLRTILEHSEYSGGRTGRERAKKLENSWCSGVTTPNVKNPTLTIFYVWYSEA